MNKQSVFLPLIISMLALFVVPASTKTPSQSNWDDWQTYEGWGPALYYGQSVKIHYVAVNTWVLNMKDNGDGTWTINQELTQKGMAYVYDMSIDNLIDKKNFRVVEVTHGIVNYVASWYDVYSLQYIHKHNYHWIITSVYHYVVYNHENWDRYSFDYWIKGVGWLHLAP